jgi:hypothetical protein
MKNKKQSISEEIIQFAPADEGWFYVEPHFDEGHYRYFINRPVGWAFMRRTGKIDCLYPVGSNGIPVTDELAEDVISVRGRDRSYWGKTWQEVFDSIIPTGLDVREIPAEMVAEIEERNSAMRDGA